MRTLQNITPTAEQLPILSRTRTGLEVIRGAAGSGKTTTALLRLRSLVGSFSSRKRRTGDTSPLRALVLTYNRTLRGYISALVEEEAQHFQDVDLCVTTYGQWARHALGGPDIVSAEDGQNVIKRLAREQGLEPDFIADEVEYVLGRFLPAEIPLYATTTRVGRGRNPRMLKGERVQLISEVINPYTRWKAERGLMDWHDVAVEAMNSQVSDPIDLVIADETQDFSANQIRSIVHHLADVHSFTVVLDAVQRIYARGFTWAEVGLTLQSDNVHRLRNNYRNTKEIAKFAASIVDGVEVDDDGSLPDFNSCERTGSMPILLKGKFSRQLAYCVEYLRTVNLSKESVAFLHPKGGGWFDEIRTGLNHHGFPFVEISRQSEWPTGEENIALSTLHSAKGLEFDHVFILGLNADTMSHGADEDDHRLTTLRRLLAMGVSRAKVSVVLGYKPGAGSRLIDFLNTETFTEVSV